MHVQRSVSESQMNAQAFNWQQKGWPKATCNRAALRDELKAFVAAFKTLKRALKGPQDIEAWRGR